MLSFWKYEPYSVFETLEYLCHCLAGTWELSYSPIGIYLLCFFFWLDTKEERSSLSCTRQSAESLTKQSETSCFIGTICMASPRSFDKRMHLKFSISGPVNVNASEISDFPRYPVHNLWRWPKRNKRRWDHTQALCAVVCHKFVMRCMCSVFRMPCLCEQVGRESSNRFWSIAEVIL